jgi:ribA/ribD-fused uncharacterized protein
MPSEKPEEKEKRRRKRKVTSTPESDEKIKIKTVHQRKRKVSSSTSESSSDEGEIKDDPPRRKRRVRPSSPESENDEKVKRPRRSEPVKKATTETTKSKVERRHFFSRRSEPPPLPEVNFSKLAAGEYPIHVIPKKWNLSFKPEELIEIKPIEKKKKPKRESSPQPITISSGTESSSNSPLKKMPKRLSFIANFWRAKPPFPRPKFVIAKDGTCLSLFFTNRYVFSNHFPADFTVNGITYSCSEQYYMRFKAIYFGDEEIAAQMMQTSDPKEMKRLGRQVEGFDENIWKKVSCQVMKIGCYNKFTQNKALRYELFRTIDTTLVEASPLDRYWGVGLSMENEDIRNPKKWRGENLLGYILTKLREYLKKQPEYQEEMKEVFTEFDPSV